MRFGFNLLFWPHGNPAARGSWSNAQARLLGDDARSGWGGEFSTHASHLANAMGSSGRPGFAGVARLGAELRALQVLPPTGMHPKGASAPGRQTRPAPLPACPDHAAVGVKTGMMAGGATMLANPPCENPPPPRRQERRQECALAVQGGGTCMTPAAGNASCTCGSSLRRIWRHVPQVCHGLFLRVEGFRRS